MFFSGKKSKKVLGLIGLVLFVLCFVGGLGIGAKALDRYNEPVTVYAAEEETVGRDDVKSETDTVLGTTAATGNGEEVEYEVEPWKAKDKFRFFLCFVFAVALCVVAAFWGDPKEGLREHYRRARKKRKKEERKRKKEEAMLKKKQEASDE